MRGDYVHWFLTWPKQVTAFVRNSAEQFRNIDARWIVIGVSAYSNGVKGGLISLTKPKPCKPDQKLPSIRVIA